MRHSRYFVPITPKMKRAESTLRDLFSHREIDRSLREFDKIGEGVDAEVGCDAKLIHLRSKRLE